MSSGKAATKGRAKPAKEDSLPSFVRPQLCRLLENPPSGEKWVHEIKLDGYRIHARIDGKNVKLLTRTGLDWTDRYGATAAALRKLKARSIYLDGELCAVSADGSTSFAAMQAATDTKASGDLIYFAFDLLYLDGEDWARRPLLQRKERLAASLAGAHTGLRYSELITGDGAAVLREACKLGAEGIVSKQADRPYAPGDRVIWTKAKCLNRQEFVIVGWTPPKGGRQGLGALLLGYHDADGKLVYAGRVGTGMTDRELTDLVKRLKPLAVKRCRSPCRRHARRGSGRRSSPGRSRPCRQTRGPSRREPLMPAHRQRRPLQFQWQRAKRNAPPAISRPRRLRDRAGNGKARPLWTRVARICARLQLAWE
jgi:DNA ligase D-like protein (predicted ligase)